MVETRLDRLWAAVQAEPDAEGGWLAFYESLATARLHLALESAGATRIRPLLVTLEAGPAALAFDSEDRFAAAIARPTETAVLTGAELAALLAGQGIALALNPGADAGCETVLEPGTLGWIAEHLGAEPGEAAASGRIGPPPAPDPALLGALAQRIADLGGALAEAWLVALAAPGGAEAAELVLVVRLADGFASFERDVVATLARTGQILTSLPFAVAPSAEGDALLGAARRHGIGIAG